MNRKKIVDNSRIAKSNINLHETSRSKNGLPFVPICAENGRVIGFITDPEICSARKVIDFRTREPVSSSKRIIPCISNDELRAAVNGRRLKPAIRVTVAGGIVRHSIR